MGTEETFDSFYKSTRTAVLHQAFALTGDLPAAQAAVRDAYVGAWHHWRKVSRLEDPRDWVRPHAWQLAQRRHTARIWHRSRGIPEDHKRVLDAVGKLSSAQRRVLLLTVLARVSLSQSARELGVTRDVAQRLLAEGTTAFAEALDVPPADVRRPLMLLEGSVHDATLPRPSIVRRAGQKRRQLHTVVAVVAAAFVALASGAFAYAPTHDTTSTVHLLKPRVKSTPQVGGPMGLPSAGQLLDKDQIRRLAEHQDWVVDSTDNNTSGDGINTICQQTRYADPDGLSALVRKYHAEGHPTRSAVQTVEISKTLPQAKDTFATTLGWYAGCQTARLQLLNAYRVDNIGDEASILMVRVWTKPVTTYSVAIARIGNVTTTTVARNVGASPAKPLQLAQSLADSVSMLCGRSGSTDCAKQPTYERVPPPPSGIKGVLAVADLPPVGDVQKPWAATEPQAVGKNPSMTTCDRADFAKSGGSHVTSRTYLIPDAGLPDRFGLSETYGAFSSSDTAQKFLTEVRHSVAGCEKRDLATKVVDHDDYHKYGADYSVWTLQTEVSQHETVRFRVGFIREGARVAQLTFSPGQHDDMSYVDFRALLVRAGDRLLELD